MELMSILLDCNYKESEKMANITNYLNKIKTAVYGKEVRGAIHDAIKECYDDASVNHDNANMEVKMARGTHNTLNDRLDKSEQKLDETNAQLLNISNLSLVANSGYVFIEMNGNIIGNGVKINNGSIDTSQPIPDELHDEYRFIPDDMNTGILTKELETFTITSAGEKEKIGNLEFNIASSGYLNLDFNYNANNKAFVSNDSIIEIENIDFYDWCKINVDRFNIDTDKSVNYTVKFKNCKFSKVTGHKSNSVANILFENCEFRDQVTLMNATYNKCYCGGEESIGRGFDGIYPYSNCHFKDCYFYFKCYKGGSGNHVDFVQYGGLENGIICENITVDNCRFEMPFLKLNGEVTDYPNACLMIQAERGSLNNIKITNCICNGGGYVFYLNEKGYSITNAVVDNIEIGASKRYGYLYPNRPDSYTWTNVRDTDILHVSSIYKSNNSTFITVTNDTNSDKELTIMTNKETFTKIIPKMPTYEQLSESDTFDDLPINLKIELGYDASWVVCKCDNVYLNAKKFF